MIEQLLYISAGIVIGAALCVYAWLAVFAVNNWRRNNQIPPPRAVPHEPVFTATVVNFPDRAA